MHRKQPSSSITRLDLSDITLDPEIHPRQQLNQEVITEYAELMEQGVKFPPVIVFYNGGKYWLADGFHRIKAKKSIGGHEIFAEVRQGNHRDAVLFAIEADTTHRLRRTNSDKKKIITKLLQDPEWGKWSNCEIARRCGVNEKTVRNTRKQLCLRKSPETINSKVPESSSICFVRRNNKTFSMNVTNIGCKTMRNKQTSNFDKIAQ